jgi:regulator of nonsense transcripts 2
MVKVLLDDFSFNSIEVLCNFLECCGRFLFKTPENRDRTTAMLEIMNRKKGLKNIDGRQVLMLENAYYQCNPPDIQAVHTKVRTPIELYIRHLLYRVLSKQTAGDIVKTFRKLDWNDEAIVSMLARYFIKIWKIRYSNLHLVAYIVSQLDKYHPDFTMLVIHATLESLKQGMELNFYKVCLLF